MKKTSPGSRRTGRNRKTSGTPIDAEKRPKGEKGAGYAGKYPRKTTGKPYRERKEEGEKREGKPSGERPYSTSAGYKGGRFRKEEGRSSEARPRFSGEGIKKPYRKFDGENKPDARGESTSEGRPERKFNRDKPYQRSDSRKSFSGGSSSYGKSGGYKRPFRKTDEENKPDGQNESGEERKPVRKYNSDRPYQRSDSRKPFSGGSGSYGKSGGYKRPYRKTDEENKPEGKVESGAEGKPERNYKSDRPYQRPDSRKPFSGSSGGYGKSGGYKKPYGKPDSDRKPDDKGDDRPKWNRKENHEFYGDRKKRPRTFNKPVAGAEPKVDDGTTRLNKFISNAGICSRREADDLISTGVISVNGTVVTTLGYKVQPGDVVRYNDAKLKSEKPVYLLLNKPKDYITTVDDPQNRQTVMSLIKHACKERVYPVGRLDRNTTGLLLFTNDGDLADKLTHPSFEVQKVYEVHLDSNLKREHFEEIGSGITLEDGLIRPDEISYTDDKSIIGIEIHSGRNRIVRRIFEHFGYRVGKLDRVLYAGLTKKDLPRGKFRFLTDLELANLKMMTGNKRFKAAPKRIVLAEE